MRIWLINPAFLDDKRLGAAHHEIHAFLTCVRTGRTWGNTTRDLKSHLEYTQRVHDQIVWELTQRKNLREGKEGETLQDNYFAGRHSVSDHATPYNIEGITVPQDPEPFQPNRDLIRKDITDLREKWEAEGYYYGIGRLSLRVLETRFDLPVGKAQLEAGLEQTKTRLILKIHKTKLTAWKARQKPRPRIRDCVDWLKSQNLFTDQQLVDLADFTEQEHQFVFDDGTVLRVPGDAFLKDGRGFIHHRDTGPILCRVVRRGSKNSRIQLMDGTQELASNMTLAPLFEAVEMAEAGLTNFHVVYHE